MFKGEALSLIKRTVARLSPGVAQLLPGHTSLLEYLMMAGVPPVAYSMVQNRTLEWLQLNGRCLDFIKRNKEGTLIARKSINEKMMISIMPLFATDIHPECTSDDESCPHRPLCFGHVRSRVRLCPMSTIAHFTMTNDPSKANAEYQWSMWNNGNSQAYGRGPARMMSETANKLTFDIFATKPIAEGDEIILDIGETPISDFVPVHSGMFPDQWLEAIPPEENTHETLTNHSEPESADL
jgi:hypothetical protein